ncbi:MAG TPA: ATP-binding protein [Candidatus Norongarragalinales archaeon]|nr:ATP-binding protein [Candidatus Norongarragalinales archaeon]
MMLKSVLGTILKDQIKDFAHLEDSIPRSITPGPTDYQGTSAFIITGLRRCGKSTLLKQIIKTKYAEDYFYFNFDDERIAGFKAEDFQNLLEASIEIHGKKNNLFFDEIQNVPGWELFVNRMLREGHRVFITGSNAHLLSRELGTHLTGRHVDVELYPFSFVEFLRAHKIPVYDTEAFSTEENALFSKKFKQYVEKGGMPEAIVFSNEAVLTSVLNDIIQKDIVTRYALKKPAELKTVVKFLIANAAKPFTYRSITDNFNIKSPITLQKYIDYAEETYLIFTVRRFERKTKRLDKNPKKAYCVDNGIIAKNTPAVNEMKGALLENVVAIHLKRLGKEIYYHKTDHSECDFVLPKEKNAIQVCYTLNADNREREIKGLLAALDELNAKNGLILTLEQEETSFRKGKTIRILPTWKWLLKTEPNEKTKTRRAHRFQKRSQRRRTFFRHRYKAKHPDRTA